MQNSININPDYLRALTLIAAKRDIHHYLNGVLVEITARETRYVATDGHHLAVIREAVPSNEPDQVPAPIIIPRDTCKAAKREKTLLAVLKYGDKPLDECRIECLKAGAALVFTPIDGRFPDFSRVIPSKVSGEPGAYNWRYLADFDDLARIAFNRRISCELHPNGVNGCALVLLTGNPFIGAIMPMRNNNPAASPELPEWWTGKRADLKVAA